MTKNNHTSKPKVIGIIPARYASTRFPGKMLAPIGNKTLIERTHENAQRCSFFDTLIVATDDQRIFDHVKDFGGTVVMTSPTCATGSDRLVEVIKNHPNLSEAAIVVNIQGDEPCLEPQVIQQIIEILQGDPIAVMSTAIVPITSMEDAHNSSIVKCVIDKNNNALYFSRALIPSGYTHQLLPGIRYYRHMGIYAYRREFLLRYAELPVGPLQIAEDLEQLKVLENGFRIKAAIVDSISIGVDRPDDINKVEQWLCKQNTSSSQVGSVLL